MFISKQIDRSGGRMPKSILIIAIGIIVISAGSLLSQDIIPREPVPLDRAPHRLVDFPTAGNLKRASFEIELDAFSAGGLLGAINIGLHNRFMIGVSYGGVKILGSDEPDWNERPQYLVKLLLIDENLGFPAVSLGYESQGTGAYDAGLDRYHFKAPGFYLVVSKAYRFMDWLSGIHGGINYNPMEGDKDNDKDISFYGGFDISFNRNLTFLGEYQSAFNDNRSGIPYGRGRGYLNFAFKWNFSERLELTAKFKDILKNSRGADSITRELRLTYVERF